MNLVPNAGLVFRKSWSVKAMAISAVLGAIQTSLTTLGPAAGVLEPAFGIPNGTIGALAAIVASLGILLRLLAQEEISG